MHIISICTNMLLSPITTPAAGKFHLYLQGARKQKRQHPEGTALNCKYKIGIIPLS